MFLKRVFPCFFLAALVLAGCSRDESNPSPPDPNIVASFNGGVITKAQVNAKYDSLMPCCKDRYEGEEGRRSLIKEMVLPTVISQAIKSKKIDLRENIREQLGDLRDELNMSFLHIKFHEQILDSSDKYADLKSSYDFQKKRLEGFPLSERFNRLVQIHGQIHPVIAEEVEKMTLNYLQKQRNEASITKNYDVLKVEVSEEELKDFYYRHKQGLHSDEYQVPERVRVQEIIIDSAGNDAARKKADAALLELRSGADFQTVAQKYNDQKSAAKDSRWLARGTESMEFEEAVFALEEGEISPVLEHEADFYIVKVLEKQAERFKSYGEIHSALEKEYRWQKGEEYLKDNRDRILFTVNSRPYTIGDFLAEYNRENPAHGCHHMQEMDDQVQKIEEMQPCDFSHNSFEDQKKYVDNLIDRELILEDTYSQMLHVEHGKEIEIVTMASLYPIFHQEEMKNLIHVSDEMVEQYFQKNKEAYLYPAKAKLSVIIIQGGETEESKRIAFEKAEKAYRELKPSFFSFSKGKDFAEVAREYSDDKETAAKGGRFDIDVYECRNAIEYMLLHGFHQKIFALKPGDISDIFEFENNYYIVQIREMESRKQLVFEEVREKVKEDLHADKHQKVMENWEDNLLQSAGFLIYSQVLEELLAGTKAPQKT
ncbi:MAG: peptidyl-prolyl cis-trans isomerase [Desulfobacterales bacterium]|nr:MAG: peptidyl-prolyl cis-trans isomerase [Desulfobacterales bacterium]